MDLTTNEKRQIEIEFWRDNELEKPGADSLENQLDKSGDALIFREAIRLFENEFSAAKRIVELGGGQGWASCIVKRLFPEAHVTATDISEFAVASVGRWERIFDVKLDGTAACTSDATPFGDGEVDLVFCFAAAHHFVTHEATFDELFRILSPAGVAIYVFEPSSPRWLHRAAVNRVNKKRPEVPEDVLIPADLMAMARKCGLEAETRYWPIALKRGRTAGLYFSLLSFFRALCPWLPCTANFVFRKPR